MTLKPFRPRNRFRQAFRYLGNSRRYSRLGMMKLAKFYRWYAWRILLTGRYMEVEEIAEWWKSHGKSV